MIVVVGQPLVLVTDEGFEAEGLPARIALAAAALRRSVQLVGKAGEDAEGDAVVLALARGGVGHVALLRDAGRLTRRFSEPKSDDPDAPHDREATTTTQEPRSEPSPDWTTLEAADVDLALRYLTEFSVLVLADPAEPEILRVVADAAGWAGARLVVVVRSGEAVPGSLPPDAVVYEAPDADLDGEFATLVGSFAASLDDGEERAEAFRSSVEA